VHGFEFQPEIDGLVLTLSDSLRGLARDGLIEPELSHDLSRPMLVDLSGDPAEFRLIADALQRIEDELAQPRIGQLSAIRNHVALALLAMLRQDRLHGAWSPCSSQDLQLVDRLRQNIALRLAEQASVRDHAEALGVTAARLNAACRRVAGCSTLHLLHAALLAEAKRGLLYTELPVSEIAYGLGFDDPAYFSRFFAQRTGRTPSGFRALYNPAG
jgi:AraC family transcriptional activator of pobA